MNFWIVKLWTVILLLALLPVFVLTAAEPPTATPTWPTGQPTPAVAVPVEVVDAATTLAETPERKAQERIRRIPRSERKLAREVIRDAARAMDMGRIEFMRSVDAGDAEACSELKCSLVMNDAAGEIDIDRLGEILAMILEFIQALLSMFAFL